MPESRKALQFLIDASEILGSSLDYESSLSSTARLAVGHLADWCIIDIVKDQEIHRVVTAHQDPAKEELAERVLGYGAPPDGPGGATEVIRTGRPLLYPEIPTSLLKGADQDPRRVAVIQELGLKSLLIVPLIARGEVLGSITLVSAESGRRYGEAELRLAEDLARRAAVSVDNARLYREAQEARELVEQQAAELEGHVEELQVQAAQLEESQAELEAANEELRRANGELFARTVESERVRGEAERANAALQSEVEQRKAAEEALRESEVRYRRLVETSPYAIYALDRDGRFTELNPAAETLLGRPASELLGCRFAEITAPEDVAWARSAQKRRLAGEVESADREVHITNAAGERRLVHVRATVIREGGVVVGTHGTARDITEERAREGEMRLLATALEGLEEGVTIMRFDGQLIYANSTHARLMGYKPGNRALPRVTAFLPDKAEAKRLDDIFRTVAEHGAWAGRVRRRRVSDGAVIPMELIVGRVDRVEGESLVFNISRDLTSEIQKEQQLRRVERLASVGTLIGGVAHELNNPLHAIRNFAELLLMEARGTEDREALEIIQREADRAAKVVADLRMIARQTQEIGAEHEATDLNDIVRHVLKVRRYSLETGNVEVQEDLADHLPYVLANRGEIEQVVLNVVVNAEQAMQGQKGARRLIVRTRGTSDGAVLHIEDNGPGVSPQQLERIFDPFYTTKAPGEGTGLGLALVHAIIAEHGGNVHVDSEVGKGTAFRIDLPRARGRHARAERKERTPAAPAHALRVLVVDDEESVRRVSARFLERVGHQVDTVADGAEALRRLGEAKYDAVVADLRMPGLDGEELFHRLRDLGSGLERHLVFLTGDAASEQAARLIAEARVPVLVKPVRLADLARAVASAARGWTPEPEGSR